PAAKVRPLLQHMPELCRVEGDGEVRRKRRAEDPATVRVEARGDVDRDPPRGTGKPVGVDIPSGLDADSGRVLGAALPADLTVTFHAAKLGHVLEEGPDLCGRLAVADIGLAGGGAVRTVRPDDLAKRGGHKYAHGHALILAGGVGRGGAARLAARGALRIGAGLVTVACPPAALIENAARLDAIMLRAAKGAEGVAAILADPRITTVCAGPGLGTGAETREVVHALLAAGRATVLDADALTAFAEAPETLFDAIPPGAPVVLTPHGGEFARLFPDIQAHWTAAPTPGPAPSKLDAARAAAARAGATVLLKGPDTVIAGPDGTASVAAATQHRACPWLATAGAGDVLAGLIAGLLARGFPPATAAAQAAWLHQEAAREIGPGLIAEDLPEALPAILRRLEA
ncbi:MAG: NAD(P)H-hydrate dehydratase, partial [Pseudomonadota bacterium]